MLFVHFDAAYLKLKTMVLCTSQNEASTSPLGNPPRVFQFLKIFCSNPLSRGQKAVQMPHNRSISGDQMPPPPGKLRGCCLTFR